MDCNSFVTHLLSSQLYSSMAYLSAETLAGQSMTVKRTDKCGSPASPQMIGIELAKSSPNMGYSNQNITNDDLVGDLCVASYFGWRSPLPVIIFSTIVEAANRSYCSLVGTWCQGTISRRTRGTLKTDLSREHGGVHSLEGFSRHVTGGLWVWHGQLRWSMQLDDLDYYKGHIASHQKNL